MWINCWKSTSNFLCGPLQKRKIFNSTFHPYSTPHSMSKTKTQTKQKNSSHNLKTTRKLKIDGKTQNKTRSNSKTNLVPTSVQRTWFIDFCTEYLNRKFYGNSIIPTPTIRLKWNIHNIIFWKWEISRNRFRRRRTIRS